MKKKHIKYTCATLLFLLLNSSAGITLMRLGIAVAFLDKLVGAPFSLWVMTGSYLIFLFAFATLYLTPFLSFITFLKLWNNIGKGEISIKYGFILLFVNGFSFMSLFFAQMDLSRIGAIFNR